jgi:lipoprotein-anchoring transpeptidase ErfK/SrfK
METMDTKWWSVRAAALFAFALVSACVEPSALPTNTPIPPAPTSSSAEPKPAAEPKAEATVSRSPITLAVLDSMLYDPVFAEELAAKAGLTPKDLDAIRKIAGDARTSLTEDEGVDDERSTTDAELLATRQLDEAVGAEKAKEILRLAGERWKGGDIAEKPGTVPTDTRIVVNTPAYRLDVFENGSLRKSYLVGIGYPEFPLPTGLRKASEIILNPTWTPPDEPWVKGKVKPGERIEAGDPRNPLGPIKIPIGLPSLIHGGKSASKLGTFASHGCVGMTTAQIVDFTPLVARMGDASISEEELAQLTKKKGDTKVVKLGTAIPVELRYETIVVEDGKLHVYRDVYDRKTNTEAHLASVLTGYGVSLDDLTAQEKASALDALKEMSRRVAAPQKAGEKKPDSGKVTTSVKGKKEVTVEIAALAGKGGYPAPVDLNTGGAPKRGTGSTKGTPKAATGGKKRG